MKKYHAFRCPCCGSIDLKRYYTGFSCLSCNYESQTLLEFKVLNPESLKFTLKIYKMYLTRKNEIVKINEFNEEYKCFIGSNGVQYNYRGHDIRDNSENDLIQEY